MNNDLSDLYQALILEHSKQPSHYGPLQSCTHQAHGSNPLCGDQVTVFARLEAGRLEGLQFTGQGCAISQASASLMTEALEGQPLQAVEYCQSLVQRLVSDKTYQPSPQEAEILGDLVALSGVRQFPARVKCATLAWHTLQEALSRPTPASEST